MGERVGELAGELREMRDGREKRKIEIEIEGDRVVGDGEGSTRLRKSSGVWYCSSRHFVRGSASVASTTSLPPLGRWRSVGNGRMGREAECLGLSRGRTSIRIQRNDPVARQSGACEATEQLIDPDFPTVTSWYVTTCCGSP